MAVGLELHRLPGDLSYWRDRGDEIDFVHSVGRDVVAIEVKSGRKSSLKGMGAFRKQFKKARGLVLREDDFEAFSAAPEAFIRKNAV